MIDDSTYLFGRAYDKEIWKRKHVSKTLCVLSVNFFGHETKESKHCRACRNGYLKVNPNSDESLRLLVANLHKMQPLVLEAR